MSETNEPAKETKKAEEPPFICPKCGRNDTTVVAEVKRGRTVKCRPEKGGCGFDGFKPEDFGTRRNFVQEAARELKKEFPMLTFIQNLGFPANPLTGRESDQRTRYDYTVWLGPNLLERIRFLTVRNTEVGAYLNTPEQYLLGDPRAVEYLQSADRDALYGFYLADCHADFKVLLAEARKVAPYLKSVKDRFENEQYSIPVEVRPLLLLCDHPDKERLLLRRLGSIVLERQEVL